MTRMSPHGRTDGYVLLDAVLAILIAALFSAILVAGFGIATRAATGSFADAAAAIRGRNAHVVERLNAR